MFIMPCCCNIIGNAKSSQITQNFPIPLNLQINSLVLNHISCLLLDQRASEINEEHIVVKMGVIQRTHRCQNGRNPEIKKNTTIVLKLWSTVSTF